MTQPSRPCWSVVAPFFRSGGIDRWIDDFVPNGDWTFRKVPLSASDDWHSRPNRATGLAKWLEYWGQAGRAFPAAGVITVFPQPALVTAVQKSLRRQDIPLIAWCFNLGEHPRGVKKLATRAALKSVDRFVVHSSGEVPKVSELLGISRRKIEFVPLQRAPIPIEVEENTEAPFIIGMGSANRDYRTLFRAAEISGLPCKVIASPRSIEGLNIPPNVTVASGLSATECHRLVQQSRFSVVPLSEPDIASGQVTVIESMRMNRPVIATEGIGTVDYIRSGETGMLVPLGEPKALAAAMQELWDDAELRQRLTKNAAAFAEESLSDPAAARALARIMSDVEAERGK